VAQNTKGVFFAKLNLLCFHFSSCATLTFNPHSMLPCSAKH